MKKPVIIQSFPQPLTSLQRLAWVKGEIWLAGGPSKQLIKGVQDLVGDFQITKKLKIPFTNPGGMAWDGKKIIIADRINKVVHLLNPATGNTESVISLSELKFKDGPEMFRVKGTEVTDITWALGHLWATCKAGYSSAIYEIDLKAGKIVKHNKSRGPDPEGISFDSSETYYWTVDSRNLEFSQFTPDGVWTEVAFPSPVKKPQGLGIDDRDTFWTLDLDTKKVYNFGRGV